MLRKILVVGVISLLFLGMVHGQSDAEKRALAKMYYEEAEKKYGEGDCIGAREAVVVGRGYSEEIGDAGGMNSCDLLIGQINPCLAAKGEEIYVNAKDLFNVGQSYLSHGSYDLAKQNFLRANTTVLEAKTYFAYMIPPYQHKVEECENLSYKIAGKIGNSIPRANRYLKNAHDIYSTGLDKYGVRYLLDSRENAQRAYEIYKSCNDAEGIYSAGKLVEDIEEDILNLEELANQLYDGGQIAYNSGGYYNYRAAYANFQKCSMYYEIVNKSLEKKQCDDMADACYIHVRPPTIENHARQKYDDAMTCRNYEDWDKCINGASEAKNIYDALYELKYAEKDFNEVHRYADEATKCETLRRECQGGMDREEKIKVADELYQKAQEAYNSGKYEDALNYNGQVFNISVEVNDPTGITKCEMFKPRIEEKLSRLEEANSYYIEARSCYDRGDYGNATGYLSKAVEIYCEINRYTEDSIEYQNCVELNNSLVNAPIAETTTSVALEEEPDYGSGMLLVGLAILFLAILILGAIFFLRRR